MTRMEAARLRAMEHRIAHAGRCELVALMDQITDTYRDPARREPGVAALHDTLAARLAATTEET